MNGNRDEIKTKNTSQRQKHSALKNYLMEGGGERF